MSKNIALLLLIPVCGIVAYSLWQDHSHRQQTIAFKEIFPAYQKMLEDQIMTQWDCTPDTGKEAFIFSMMERFDPRALTTISEGRVWKAALAQKEKDGSITVAEREMLYSGAYVHPDEGTHKGIITGMTFQPPQCSHGASHPQESCTHPFQHIGYRYHEKRTVYPASDSATGQAFSTTESTYGFSMAYEDQYARWTLQANNWDAASYRDMELQGNTEHLTRRINAYWQSKDEILQKAKDSIGSAKASDIAGQDQESLIERKYKILLCSEMR